MFTVDSIWEEGKKIIGVCDDDKFFRWVGDAVSLIANKEDLEGLKGYLDICTAGCHCSENAPICNNPAGCGRRCVSLPREVLTVIGVNIGGQPILGRSQLFEFHLNGTGSCRTACEWSYDDKGYGWPTYRDLVVPAKLVAYVNTPEDNGVPVIAFGYDRAGNVLRRNENGVWKDGYRVPTIYGLAIPDAGAPEVARITRIMKGRSVAQVRLSTIDDSGTTGVLLGVYEPDETLPQYRRIRLNRSCSWVRIAYLKSLTEFHSRWDHIPMSSRVAFLMALQARKFYSEVQVAQGNQYEANAARLELEAQMRLEPPTFMPPQIIDLNGGLRNKYDYDIR